MERNEKKQHHQVGGLFRTQVSPNFRIQLRHNSQRTSKKTLDVFRQKGVFLNTAAGLYKARNLKIQQALHPVLADKPPE